MEVELGMEYVVQPGEATSFEVPGSAAAFDDFDDDEASVRAKGY